MFDWNSFLTQHNIEHEGKGAEVKLKCPFCLDDPSRHMNVNIHGKGWHCWRNPEHAGRSPVKLIQALLHCEWQHAFEIAGYAEKLINNDFISQVNQLMSPTMHAKQVRQPLAMPAEFKSFTGLPSSKPFVAYLERRGFSHPPFSLRYCTKGAYHGRIIIPIYDKKELVCWTGRTIYASEVLRYKTLSTNEDKAAYEGYDLAVNPITHYLLFQDRLRSGGKALFICEGPFDALKVQMLSKRHNIQATCLFTSAMSVEQAATLEELEPHFTKLFLMLDREAYPVALRVCSQHSFLSMIPVLLPEGVKDPGDLTQEQFHDILKKTLVD